MIDYRGGIFSDTEIDPCNCNPRKIRQRQSRRIKNETDRGVKYTDFGFIDEQIENVYQEKRFVKKSES